MNQIVSFGSSPALDGLRLPDGRKVADVDHGPLYGEFARLGISGFSHAKGRQDNIAAYAAHLEAIAAAAGQAAIAAWMETKRNI
jgi:hypothetical protein